jgi:tRNA wybutosine-synthesizing protein 3
MFDSQKEATLKRMRENDHSKKGSVDADIRELIDMINEHTEYYTTSSCSGRITVMEHQGRKNNNTWLLTEHREVSLDEVKHALKKREQGDIWFRQESPILHLCARSVESGKQFLELARKAGFKYVYFLSVEPRVMIEIQGSEKMETILAKDDVLVDDAYLSVLIEEANKKLVSAKSKLEKLYSLLKEDI